MDNLDTKTKLGTRHRSKKKKQLKETKMMSNIKWPHQKQVVNSGAREVPVSYKAPVMLFVKYGKSLASDCRKKNST
jgi:hypothetical protein